MVHITQAQVAIPKPPVSRDLPQHITMWIPYMTETQMGTTVPPSKELLNQPSQIAGINFKR